MGDKNRLYIKPLIIFFVFFSLAGMAPLFARDFHEPIPAIDPLYKSASVPLERENHIYGKLEYNNHIFHGSENDSFDVSTLLSTTLVNFQNIIALKLYYGSYLLVGPTAQGDTAASIAQWWMNAVQFEYGAIAGVKTGPIHLLFEYARTSQHRLRAGYSEVASDIIRTGVVLPRFEMDPFTILSAIRLAYIDLYDLWGSSIPKPRTKFLINPAVEVSFFINEKYSIYSETNIDLNYTTMGKIDMNIKSIIGLKTYGKTNNILPYVEFYYSPDSEEVEDRITPVLLFGLGFRSSTGN
jgi:hypothetical protein